MCDLTDFNYAEFGDDEIDIPDCEACGTPGASHDSGLCGFCERGAPGSPCEPGT